MTLADHAEQLYAYEFARGEKVEPSLEPAQKLEKETVPKSASASDIARGGLETVAGIVTRGKIEATYQLITETHLAEASKRSRRKA